MELIKDLPEVFEEFAEQYIFPERDCNGDGGRMRKPLLNF